MRRNRRVLVLAAVTSVAVGGLALALGGGGPVGVPAGLPDAGPVIGWALRLLALLTQLCAVLTVGSLLVGAVLLPRGDQRPAGGAALARRATRLAGGSATVWCLLTAAVLVLTVADTAGVPLHEVRTDHVTPLLATGRGTALLVTVLLTGLLAPACDRARTPRGDRLALLLALAALLPTAMAGHPASAADQDVATSGLVVHVVAATLWLGGLTGLLVHLRHAPEHLTAAAPRLSTLALTTYVTLTGAGVLTASTHLDLSARSWLSGYAGILAVKVLLVLALGVLGHRHRRRTLPRLAEGRSGPFLRLAGVELVVMGAAMGLASALSQTPTPPTSGAAAPSHGLGHSTLPTAVDPVSFGELAGAWRPNAVVLVVLGLALAGYLSGLRGVAQQGIRWPVPRTLAFVGGLALALVDLCSGVATYAPALVSVQLGQLLVALLAVPALLAAGAPLTLWRLARTAPTRPAWTSTAHVLSSPVVGAALVCTLLLGLYRTPLIEVSLRSLWVHLLVQALAVTAGTALWVPVLGVDPVLRPRALTERAACVAAVVGCLLLLAAQLRLGDRLLAGDWFLTLGWGWVDPVADQRLGGLVAAAAALGTLTVLAAVVRSSTRPRPGGAQPVTDQSPSSTRPSRSSAATAP